jgi:hypothetical protein
MWYPLALDLAHLQVFAQHVLHYVVVEAKQLADLFLRQESLAFDRVGDSIDIS